VSPGYELQCDVQQRGVEDLAAQLRHHALELRKPGVRHSAASHESLDDAFLHLRELGEERGEDGQVLRACSARDDGGVLRRQPVRLVRRLVFDDSAGNHRTQPLAHVALVQAGALGDLSARGRLHLGQPVDQSGVVAKTGNQREIAAIHIADDLTREGFHSGFIQRLRRHSRNPFLTKNWPRHYMQM